ncbi:MAG: hypothetical protein B6I18_00840 [Bacteroidetes bacterium 4572_112]|nr:MAG: hypothetical protein B6I18_00840 [Bacteroidetes bacterium 4572_112]
MEWYIPITIIPGIGLIITSTSNIMLELNREITELINVYKADNDIISAKLTQLKTLSISIAFQYLGILFFLLSGITTSLIESFVLQKSLLIIGVVFIAISVSLLLIYSIKAVIPN